MKTREERDKLRRRAQTYGWKEPMPVRIAWMRLRALLDAADEAERLKEGMGEILGMDWRKEVMLAGAMALPKILTRLSALKEGK